MDAPLFPLTQGVYLTPEIKAKLQAKHAAAYAKAVEDDDMLRQMEVSENAWRDYLRLLKSEPSSEYDSVTGMRFAATATRFPSELLYRHYFGTFPFPPGVVSALERVRELYGLSNLSAGFAFWRERGYNHRNVAGIANYVKNQYEKDERQAITVVPAIFLEEKEE